MPGSTMNAVVYTRYGGPEVTQMVPLAVPDGPTAGEVRVRVVGGGLNPVDWHQRQGEFRTVYPQTLPVVAGNEFSGVVTDVGDGVARFAAGDHVVCRSAKSTWGALAQYVVVDASIVAKAPTSIPLVHAAGLPLAGLTAEQALDALNVTTGDRLLITGGAGGVGQFAIQLAKVRGAHVTTTASEAGRPYVLEAGADSVVDYRTQKLTSAQTHKFTKVFDTVGGDALASDVIPATAAGGTVVSVGGPQTPGCLDAVLPWWKATIVNIVFGVRTRSVTRAAAAEGVAYQYMFMRPDGAQLQRIADLADEGKVTVHIDSHFKLNEYKKAFERLESNRAKGKIVIEFPEPEASH